MSFVFDPLIVKQAQKIDAEKLDFELLSEEELEERIEKKEKKEEGSSFSFKKSFPFFVLFFILASVVTTIFHLPAAVTGPLKELSKFLIVMAMAAIGLNTNIVHLVKTGAKPIFTGFCCWVGISLVSLGMQHMMGLW